MDSLALSGLMVHTARILVPCPLGSLVTMESFALSDRMVCTWKHRCCVAFELPYEHGGVSTELPNGLHTSGNVGLWHLGSRVSMQSFALSGPLVCKLQR